jgi:hypothetical protein
VLSRWLLVFVALSIFAAPLAAGASNVALTVGAGKTASTPGNPSTGDATATVSGSIDATEALSIDLSVAGTHDSPAPPAASGTFGSSGGNVASFTAGPTWMPNDNWMVNLAGNFSPKGTTFSDTSLQLNNAAGTKASDAQLKSIDSSWGLNLGASYDTSGDSSLEHSVGLGASLMSLNNTQSISATRDAKTGKVINDPMLEKTVCAPGSKKTLLCKQLASLTRGEPTNLDQFAINASYTATVFDRTDLTVGGAYYLYNTDPTQVGYFNVATVGRGVRSPGGGPKSDRGGAEFSFGGGAPLEPLLFGVSTGASHAFGAEKHFKIEISAGYGLYDGTNGYNLNAAVKLSYKFNKHWKATLIMTADRDIDEAGNVSPSGSASLGARYTF